MRPSSYYNRIVDVMEELVRFTVLLRPPADTLVNRYSERKEAGMVIDPSSDLSSIALSGRCGGFWANAGMPVVRFQGGHGTPEITGIMREAVMSVMDSNVIAAKDCHIYYAGVAWDVTAHGSI